MAKQKDVIAGEKGKTIKKQPKLDKDTFINKGNYVNLCD